MEEGALAAQLNPSRWEDEPATLPGPRRKAEAVETDANARSSAVKSWLEALSDSQTVSPFVRLWKERHGDFYLAVALRSTATTYSDRLQMKTTLTVHARSGTPRGSRIRSGLLARSSVSEVHRAREMFVGTLRRLAKGGQGDGREAGDFRSPGEGR
jgi:hypothetical protein